MFVREKRINGYTYLYLVETVREHGRAKQHIIKNLGRKEALAASGALERLWPAPSPATPSGPWFSRNSRPATPSGLPASASARRCCSGGCGRRRAAARSSRIS